MYNADESSLFWQVLPLKTIIYRAEKSGPRRKLTKDGIKLIPFLKCVMVALVMESN